jgi:hypothetical protein
MVNFNLVSLLSLPFALTSAFAPNPTQTRTLVGHTPSFAFVGKAPKKETALFARPDLSDDQLKDIVAETILDNDVTDVVADDIFNYIEEPVKEREERASASSGAARVSASGRLSISSKSSRSRISTDGSCEWASLEFAIEAVSLGLQASGLPGGTGRRVAKILVGKAKEKLKKEMKNIVKDYFGSPNPVNIAQGLVKIFNIIIGDIGASEFLSIVLNSVSYWDGIQLSILLTAYFISGGGGLAVKLALLTPQIIDVVEAGIEVSEEC